MSWLYDGVPQDILDKADQVSYLTQMDNEVRMAGDLMPIERLDAVEDVKRLIQEPKLTIQVREGILRRLRKGMFPESAAARVGVLLPTFNRWLEMGLKGLEPYATFYREMCEAEAGWEEEASDKLNQSDDMQDIRFMLERRSSRPLLSERAKAGGVRFRKQSAGEVEKPGEAFDFDALTDDKKRMILAKLAEQPALPAGVTEMLNPNQADVIDAT